MLAAPPDFGLMTLSEESRLGLFVVARLAHLHGVRVTLTESVYGGVQVVVLVPNALVVDPHGPTATPPDPGSDAVPRVAGPDPAGPRRAAPAPTSPDPPDLPSRPRAADQAPAVEPAGDGTAVDDSTAVDDASPAPRLPERRPQANLAGPLKDDPDRSPSADLDRTDPDDRPPQRSGSAMSALQQGSRSGRNGSTPDGGAR